MLIFLYSTFSTLHKLEDVLAKLNEVAAELEKDMEDTGWMGRTITLKYKLDTYQGKQPLRFSSNLNN